MRSVALLSLFPPARGGVADYTADLAAQLAERTHVVGYTAPAAGQRGPTGLTVRDVTHYRGDEQRTLVQVANNAHLGFVVPWLRRAHLVTLHDACQHDLLFPFFEGRPLRLLWESLRMPGEARRLLWQGVLRGGPRGSVDVLRSLPDKRAVFPFTRHVLRGVRRVVVHSRHLAEHVSALGTGARVDVVPHGVWPVATIPRGEARRVLSARLGRDLSDTLLLAAFGSIQSHKRHTAVLEALAAYVREDPDVCYVIIGPRDAEYDLDAEVTRLGLAPHVVVIEDAPRLAQVNRFLAGVDLLFGLRHPTLGSTSGALLKGLALGLPAAVTDAGSFRELAWEGVARGVPEPGEAETAACLALMREVRRNPERLREMGERARGFVERECAWPRVAARYAEILETP